jgi:hypothetical protein
MKINVLTCLGILTLISCDEKAKPDFEKIDAYPTSIGTEWTYSSVFILKIFESEISDKIIEADTVNYTFRVKVEKDTILNDTMNVIQFSSKADELDAISKQYFFVDSDGLKAYANSYYASHVFAKKIAKSRIPANMLSFNIFGPAISEGDDIFVFQPVPRLNLKLPLELNSKWTYTTPTEPLNLQIDKEIIGYENIRINDRTYSCYKISWIYIENKFFDGTKIFDWVSKEGLIKRQVIYKRASLNLQEYESWANCQATETILLKEFK